MDSKELELLLAGLPLGEVRYFDTIPSTNTAALDWAASGAASDCSLVVANEQTAGRGRRGRQWITPAGAALAFSLVLKPNPLDAGWSDLPRLNVLGALAACEAVQGLYGMAAQIKWPNDVLLGGRKAAGVLAEACWEGDELTAVVVGVGLNVGLQAVPEPEGLLFEGTSLESELGRSVDRWEMLRAILANMLWWQNRLHSPDFFEAWQQRLAYRGEWVSIQDGESQVIGRLMGLNQDGTLNLVSVDGQPIRLHSVEGSLRPWHG